MINQINLKELNYLVAVARYQHFGKAAEACFISQPALSMQIKKLEQLLGVKLFERTNKTVMVTDIGHKIIDKAQQILHNADDLLLLAKTAQNPEAGEIKLGAFPTLAPYFLPLIMPPLTQAFSQLKFFLLEEKTDQLIQQLKTGELDAAFLALPLPVLDYEQSFTVADLFQEPFYLAMAKQHRLAKQTSVSADDLASERLLLLNEGHCLRKQALDICNITGITEQQDFRATSLETLREMVAAHIGITLMPKLAINTKDNRINYLPFKPNNYARDIALVWRKTSARDKLFNHIVQQIKTIKSLF